MNINKTSRHNQFRDYQNQKQIEKRPKTPKYKTQRQQTLATIIDQWKQHRIHNQGISKDTMVVQRRKIRQLLRETGFPPDTTTLDQLLKKTNGPKGLQNLIEQYKQFLLSQDKNKNIPTSEKLGYNGIACMMIPVNPFFKHYLQLPIHIKNLAKKRVYHQRITLSQIDQILNYIDQRYKLRIMLAKTPVQKKTLRKRWSTERISVCAVKYLWTRGKEITENHLTLQDINIMKATNRLPLHSRKRNNHPTVFQQPVVTDDFIQEWNIYEHYRDSNDNKPNAPAIVQVNRQGKAITRKWLRTLFKQYRRELGLPEYITPHNIRRSMHTLMRSMTPNQMIAQVQLGDISTKIADESYNIPDTSIIKEQLERLYHCDTLPGEKKTPMETQKEENSGGDMAYA